MIITLNGTHETLFKNPGFSITDLLEYKNVSPFSVIVELNGSIIHTQNYASTRINENDSIEVLRIVGGG